jgi:heme-degrading monooxygenase HmoA
MIAQVVRFKSGLTAEEVQRTYETRAPQYRAMPGLLQKYYLQSANKQEHGAVYLFESEEALARFRESELARTIPSAYQVQGEPEIHVAEVVMTLRPDSSSGGT